MCDQRTIREANQYLKNRPKLTRRAFGALSLGAAFASAATTVEFTHKKYLTTSSNVEVVTPDGKADSFFVHPKAGSHPGVLIWPDAMGLRAAFEQMASRLAESGYSVLVINPYYRTQSAPILPEGASFRDEGTRSKIFPLMRSLTPETTVSDALACIDFLDGQESVSKNRKMGTMGYCMGGSMTMRTAAVKPERIGAGASFHGGRLVTADPSSPHLLVKKMQAQYLIAIAENDDANDPNAKTELKRAFADAGLPAEIEVYSDTLHGWCPPDSSVYHKEQADRAWGRLLSLFERALA